MNEMEMVNKLDWKQFEDFVRPEVKPRLCQDARELQEWADLLFRGINFSSWVSINQAKVLLLDQYLRQYQGASGPHRNSIGTSRHLCIFQVFMAAARRLYRAEQLQLHRPELFERLREEELKRESQKWRNSLDREVEREIKKRQPPQLPYSLGPLIGIDPE